MDVKDGRYGAPCPELVATVGITTRPHEHLRRLAGAAECGGVPVTGVRRLQIGVAGTSAAAGDGPVLVRVLMGPRVPTTPGRYAGGAA